MMRWRKIVAAMLAAAALLLGGLALWVAHVPAEDLSVAKESNSAVFDQVRDSTEWDLRGNMTWGYYFTSNSKTPLVMLSRVLPVLGYRTVDVFELEDDTGGWCLHSERTRVDSLESVSAQEVRLRRLAWLFFKSEFDGWDVGPVQ